MCFPLSNLEVSWRERPLNHTCQAGYDNCVGEKTPPAPLMTGPQAAEARMAPVAFEVHSPHNREQVPCPGNWKALELLPRALRDRGKGLAGW